MKTLYKHKESIFVEDSKIFNKAINYWLNNDVNDEYKKSDFVILSEDQDFIKKFENLCLSGPNPVQLYFVPIYNKELLDRIFEFLKKDIPFLTEEANKYARFEIDTFKDRGSIKALACAFEAGRMYEKEKV